MAREDDAKIMSIQTVSKDFQVRAPSEEPNGRREIFQCKEKVNEIH